MITRNDQWADLLCQFVFQFSDGTSEGEHAGTGKAVGAVGRSEAQNPGPAIEIDLEEDRRHGNMMHYRVC